MAGAAIVGGCILLEPEPLIAFPRLTAPSDRVRFGIVGVGTEGTALPTTAVQLPGVECKAARDLYDGRHEFAKEIVGDSLRTTRRYKELLDDKEIDAIITAALDHLA
jgi:predicted dehydrogenase